MFEEDDDDNKEKYDAFQYEENDDINISQSYTNRLLQKKRLERKMRKGNIWISRLHVLLRLLLLIGLIYVLYKIPKLPQWFVDKDIFTTSNPHLEIINNKIVPTYKILNELRKIPVINEPIYKFETDKIRLNLLELEPIDDIYIRRFWFPARLQIIVKERIPLLSIHTSGETPAIAFFTNDGVLIGEDYLPLPQTIQTIKVIAPTNFREWDKTKVDEITNYVDYVERLLNEGVEGINLSNEKDIYVKTKSLLLRVGSFDDSLYDRTARIKAIQSKLNQINKPIKYIDLRWKNTAYIKTE
jgi:cell division septal protein FtsQ